MFKNIFLLLNLWHKGHYNFNEFKHFLAKINKETTKDDIKRRLSDLPQKIPFHYSLFVLDIFFAYIIGNNIAIATYPDLSVPWLAGSVIGCIVAFLMLVYAIISLKKRSKIDLIISILFFVFLLADLLESAFYMARGVPISYYRLEPSDPALSVRTVLWPFLFVSNIVTEIDTNNFVASTTYPFLSVWFFLITLIVFVILLIYSKKKFAEK